MLYLGTVYKDCGWYVARVLSEPEHAEGSCRCGAAPTIDNVRFKARAEIDHPLADAIWSKVQAGGIKTEEEWSAGDGFPDDEFKEKAKRGNKRR